ncbi:putative mitochondrial carrier protein [Diplodia seriata]|uniref:Putative mitochondrial carrier protein n=1 Tax=Diplodia seriata TaxID=420778 RepID=A0A0G2EN85_9PEZI|nr:putative mitochondrial carrier protein [Diplodia seriata]
MSGTGSKIMLQDGTKHINDMVCRCRWCLNATFLSRLVSTDEFTDFTIVCGGHERKQDKALDTNTIAPAHPQCGIDVLASLPCHWPTAEDSAATTTAHPTPPDAKALVDNQTGFFRPPIGAQMTDIRNVAVATRKDTQKPWVLLPADWGLGGSDGRSTAESNGQDAIGAQMTDIGNVAAPTSEDYHKIKRDQYGILFDVADRKKTGHDMASLIAAAANAINDTALKMTNLECAIQHLNNAALKGDFIPAAAPPDHVPPPATLHTSLAITADNLNNLRAVLSGWQHPPMAADCAGKSSIAPHHRLQLIDTYRNRTNHDAAAFGVSRIRNRSRSSSVGVRYDHRQHQQVLSPVQQEYSGVFRDSEGLLIEGNMRDGYRYVSEEDYEAAADSYARLESTGYYGSSDGGNEHDGDEYYGYADNEGGRGSVACLMEVQLSDFCCDGDTLTLST